MYSSEGSSPTDHRPAKVVNFPMFEWFWSWSPHKICSSIQPYHYFLGAVETKSLGMPGCHVIMRDSAVMEQKEEEGLW